MWNESMWAGEHADWDERGTAAIADEQAWDAARRRTRGPGRAPRARADASAAPGRSLHIPGPVPSSCVLIVSADHETLGWALANFERYTRWIPIAVCSAERARKVAETIRFSAIAADDAQLPALQLGDAAAQGGVLRILLASAEGKRDGQDADVTISRAWPSERVADALRLCVFVQHARRGPFAPFRARREDRRVPE